MNNLQEPMVVLKYPVKLPINPKANGITTFKTKWCLFFWLFLFSKKFIISHEKVEKQTT